MKVMLSAILLVVKNAPPYYLHPTGNDPITAHIWQPVGFHTNMAYCPDVVRPIPTSTVVINTLGEQ